MRRGGAGGGDDLRHRGLFVAVHSERREGGGG